MSGTSTAVVVVVIAVLVGAVGYYAGQASSSGTTSTVTNTVTSTVSVGASGGQTTTTQTVTQSASTGVDQALYQAAQKEASVVVYGSIDSDQFAVMQNSFSTLYPGISVQYTNFSPSQIFTRITSEISASGHSADLVIVDGSVPQLQAAGDVIAYVSPYAANFPKSSLDPSNASTPILVLPQTLVYNTKMLTPSQLPKNLTDLTNPQWKGKIVMHDPTLGTGGTRYWGALSTVLGNTTVNNFLTALQKNVNPTLVPSPSGTEAAVAQGQYAIGMEVFLTDTVGDINSNSSVAPLPLQGVPIITTVSDAALLKGAQHPNSAKLLTDFLSSPAGQVVIGNVTKVLPTSSIRLPVDPNVKTVYSLTSLVSKYVPGATVTYLPNSVLLGVNSYKATYTSIFKP